MVEGTCPKCGTVSTLRCPNCDNMDLGVGFYNLLSLIDRSPSNVPQRLVDCKQCSLTFKTLNCPVCTAVIVSSKIVKSGTVARTNGLAIAALIALFFFWPCAIIFGHLARRQIRQTHEQGAGIALFALVAGYILVGLIVLFVLWFVAASTITNSAS